MISSIVTMSVMAIIAVRMMAVLFLERAARFSSECWWLAETRIRATVVKIAIRQKIAVATLPAW